MQGHELFLFQGNLPIAEAATDEIAGHPKRQDHAPIDQHECLEGHELLL
jgi:hypothetical protein